ncbi:MAG: hypothetical protein DDT18_00571 [Actinobacteria bacterium]|nr:hypothetical protein [Actinomycetota bacterium]
MGPSGRSKVMRILLYEVRRQQAEQPLAQSEKGRKEIGQQGGQR